MLQRTESEQNQTLEPNLTFPLIARKIPTCSLEMNLITSLLQHIDSVQT